MQEEIAQPVADPAPAEVLIASPELPSKISSVERADKSSAPADSTTSPTSTRGSSKQGKSSSRKSNRSDATDAADSNHKQLNSPVTPPKPSTAPLADQAARDRIRNDLDTNL